MARMSFAYENVLEYLGTERRSSWTEEDEQLILRPFHEFSADITDYKDIRSQILVAANAWFGLPPNKLAVVAKIVAMLDSAATLVNKINDHSRLEEFAQAINAANYVSVLVYSEVTKLCDPTGRIRPTVTDELLAFRYGLGLEIYWRNSPTSPTEQEYISMINQRFGSLVRLAFKIMKACGINEDIDTGKLLNLASLIGIFLRTKDDFESAAKETLPCVQNGREGMYSVSTVQSALTGLNNAACTTEDPLLTRPVINDSCKCTSSRQHNALALGLIEEKIREGITLVGGNKDLERIVDLLHVDIQLLS